jgi:hypothetical protein
MRYGENQIGLQKKGVGCGESAIKSSALVVSFNYCLFVDLLVCVVVIISDRYSSLASSSSL